MSRHTQVCIIGDRHIIQTDARRSQAVLMVLGGATLEETGVELGVTRERIRQYMRDVGLSSDVRKRWHDTERTRTYMRGAAKRQARRDKRRQNGAHVVLLLKTFAAAHDRAPTSLELYSLVFGHAPKSGRTACTSLLSQYLGAYMRGPYWRRLQAAYRLAGIHRRARGTPGHVSPHTHGAQISAALKQKWASYSPEEKAQRLAQLRKARVA